MATDFGTDISCLPDLDPSFSLKQGAYVIGEAIARRLLTQRGTLIDDPNYGTDVRGWVNDIASSGQATAQLKGAIERECRQDERVFSADAQIFYDAPSSTVSVTLQLSTAAGPFRLTLAINSVTLQILQTG